MRILFYDLETTGLSKENNEILEIAAIVYNTDTKTIENTFDKFIKPKQPVPYQITQLTGISNSMVKDSYIESIVLKEFMDWVKVQNCDMHAGHNITRFDDPWIAFKTKYFFYENTLPERSIDTLVLAKQAYTDGALPGYQYLTAKGNLSFKLEHLMDYFHLGTQEHRAITDVQFNIMVYAAIQEKLNNVSFGF